MSGNGSTIRRDQLLVANMVAPGSRVLDIGCSDGALLTHLAREKDVDGRGIELSQSGVNACVARGLSVVQGDADKDLVDYPSGAFDFVILSQTLQATHNPRIVLGEMLRIGNRAIVSFPNFGYWRVRWHPLARGRMPMTKTLPTPWYETENIHFCTIRDFVDLCAEVGAVIERRIALTRNGHSGGIAGAVPFANLLSEQGLFLLRMP